MDLFRSKPRPASLGRKLASLTAAAILLAVGLMQLRSEARAVEYPTSPITIIAPVGAGSSGDFALRIVAEKMSAILGQRIVVENVTGASGMLGTARAARAAADGYTLVGGGDTILTTVPIIYPNPGYDPLKDLVPISQIARVEWALVAAPNAKLSSVAELLAAAKASPGTVTFASGGNGSPQHIAMELMASLAGIKLEHVPYRSASSALNDVVAGFVNTMFTGTSVATPFLQDGRLKVVATAGKQRSETLPDVPTLAQSGVPGFEFSSYVALLAPAKTPRPIVEKLNAAAMAALADAEVRKKLSTAGVVPWGTLPDAFAAELQEDYRKRVELVKAVGIKPKE